MAVPLKKEVIKRKFDRVFVCRRCKSKIKADPDRVRQGKVKCRKCNYKVLRPKNKERKAEIAAAAAP